MHRILTLIVLVFYVQIASAQGSMEDYVRADALPGDWASLVRNAQVRVKWLGDGQPVYQYELDDGSTEWRTVDLASGETRQAFDMDSINSVLEGHGVQMPARVEWFDELDDRLVFMVQNDPRLWVLDPSDNSVSLIDPTDTQNRFGIAPSNTDRTTDGGFRTTVIIVNATGGVIDVQWLDYGGNPHQYAQIQPGASHRQGTYAGHAWRILNEHSKPLGVYKATQDPGVILVNDDTPAAEDAEPAPKPVPHGHSSKIDWSPDGIVGVEVKDDQVVLIHHDSGERFVMTQDGSDEIEYAGVWWSPDSRRFVMLRTQKASRRTVHVVESSPNDQLQPELISFDYFKPGDELDTPRPVLFDVRSGKEFETDQSPIVNPWSVTRIVWDEDSDAFYYLYNERGHQTLRVVRVDAQTGQSRVIVEERSDTFIDYSSKSFLRFMDGRGSLIWMSERSGWNHLYQIDKATGEIMNAITHGDWVVRSVDRVDETRGVVWIRIMGYHPDQDPYHIHFARVNLDGSGFTLLTTGDGTHAIEYSPDREFYIDTYSRVDLAPVTELRRTKDGSLVATLAQADWSLLVDAGWNPPERHVAKGRDGKTDIWGFLQKPSTLDESIKYPVIESIYAGPHGHHVPKSFSVWRSSRSLSELGFITVHIDGMGTNWRSKAFHDVAWKNLKDAGFEDRIAWMKSAATQRPWMDINRVGIYGVSAGGQNAMGALLFHNDFYDAAVADCGCHDNRMDKIWWNEQWMGYPVDESFEQSSNVSNAHLLEGDLLLTVGEIDQNVDPASTMQVVDALINADKDFEFIVFPGMGHGTIGSEYGKRRMRDFFVRSLHNREPRWSESDQ